MVLLNASSAGLPIIASRINGSIDAVVDGETGLLFEAGNIHEFVGKILKCVENPSLCSQLGSNARQYAIDNYSEKIITECLIQRYQQFVNNIG